VIRLLVVDDEPQILRINLLTGAGLGCRFQS
jgi:hypothetical protein